MRGWEQGGEQFPPGYRLDTSDTAAWVLRRADGTAVARFSAWGATKQTVERVARRDYARNSEDRGRRRDRSRRQRHNRTPDAVLGYWGSLG